MHICGSAQQLFRPSSVCFNRDGNISLTHVSQNSSLAFTYSPIACQSRTMPGGLELWLDLAIGSLGKRVGSTHWPKYSGLLFTIWFVSWRSLHTSLWE
jgi:hypothetical protein